MTNTIGSLPQSQAVSDVTGQKTEPPVARSQASSAGSAGANEAVTVSDSAKFSTGLLEAARSSNGVDHAAVQRLSAAIQNGSYNLSPEDLAGAMIAVAKAGP
jgi:flagellar biosynthesis anti-sigma factor FlgM